MNVFIVDSERWDEINLKMVPGFVMMLDLVVVRFGEDQYRIVKNRFNASQGTIDSEELGVLLKLAKTSGNSLYTRPASPNNAVISGGGGTWHPYPPKYDPDEDYDKSVIVTSGGTKYEQVDVKDVPSLYPWNKKFWSQT